MKPFRRSNWSPPLQTVAQLGHWPLPVFHPCPCTFCSPPHLHLTSQCLFQLLALAVNLDPKATRLVTEANTWVQPTASQVHPSVRTSGLGFSLPSPYAGDSSLERGIS